MTIITTAVPIAIPNEVKTVRTERCLVPGLKR